MFDKFTLANFWKFTLANFWICHQLATTAQHTHTLNTHIQYNSLYRIVCCIDRFAGNIRILFYYICLFLHHTQTSIKSMLGYAFQNVDVTSTFRLLKDTVSSVNVWRF